MPSGVSAPWAGSSSGLPGSHPSNGGRGLPGRLGGGRRSRRCGPAPVTLRGNCMAEARTPGHGPPSGVRVAEPAGYRARPVRRHAPRRPGRPRRPRGPRRRRRARDRHGVRQRTDPSAPQQEPARRPEPARRIDSAPRAPARTAHRPARGGHKARFPTADPLRRPGPRAEPCGSWRRACAFTRAGSASPPQTAAEGPAVASRRQTPKPPTRHRPRERRLWRPKPENTRRPRPCPADQLGLGVPERQATPRRRHVGFLPQGAEPVAAVHGAAPAHSCGRCVDFAAGRSTQGCRGPEAY